jgi:aminoglycoside/choline kinase family phosphotransferase
VTPSAEELQPLVPSGARILEVLPLHGDGSARRFFRVHADSGSFVLLEGPDADENAAYVRIARHLSARGIRVPRIHGLDEGRGRVLLEDLGDTSLYTALRGGDPAGALALYGPVLDLLCRAQVLGAEGFDVAVGGAPAPYGTDVMVAEEGLYFAREFAEGLLGLTTPPEYRRGLEGLARLGAAAPGHYFLHRDFQSRNIHLTAAGPAVIDFQGARPGPVAYDAATLILDPYTDLPAEVRSELLTAYLGRLRGFGVTTEGFDDAWFAVGTFRLLQALGAFAKLGGRFGKPGFLEHASNGLETLVRHLGERGRREVPTIWELVVRSREAWEKP